MYVHAHVMVRRILSEYTTTPPEDIQFTYGVYGKPSLESGNVRFNLSHSGDRVAVAVATVEVGIDIECMRNDLDFLEIAKYFFSPKEYAVLAQAEDSMAETFYRVWTCKEAYMKARGMGFSLPPRGFDACGDQGPGALSSRECSGWSLSEFECGHGYAAAVVTEASTCELQLYDYGEFVTAMS